MFAVTNRYEITMKVQKLKMSSKYISRICVHNDTERFKNMKQEINGFMKLRHCQSKMPFALLKIRTELTTKNRDFINELISGSQDIQKATINFKHTQKMNLETKNNKVES